MTRPFLIFLTLATLAFGDAPVPHSGHVAIDGTPFWGTGQFKFAIIDSSGNSLWTHDGSTASTPTGYLSLEVKNGFYSLHLGDESIAGMKALPASALVAVEKAFLQVWFSKDGSSFQRIGVDLALGASPFALVSEMTRTEGGSLEARIQAIEAVIAKIPASAIDPVLLAEVGYRKFPSRELSGLTLNSANLDDSDFSKATILSANLFQASLKNANLKGATIRDSNFSQAVFTTATFNESNLSAVYLDSINASGSSFNGAEANGSNLSQADLTLSDFNNADFSDCNFSNANLQGASMLNAKIKGSDLTSANLDYVNALSSDFSGSNLTSTTLTNASLNQAKFTNANLSGADFAGANLTGADFTGATDFNPDAHTGAVFSATTLPDGTIRN
jgi:uncharacterized protein YjbI with pentapeptide repeats